MAGVREETTMAETGAQTGEAAATALTTWVEHAATRGSSYSPS
jgi:hypothetical protein